jgi:integrase
MRVHLKHVNKFRDRHGRVRQYFRRPGQAAIALPGEPGSAEFMAAYQTALAQLPTAESAWAAGSIGAAITAYYDHPEFLGYAESTRAMRRRILELIRSKEGEKPLRGLDAPAIEKRLAQQRPHNAKNWLKTLRGLLRFAKAQNLVGSDPTAGIKIRVKGGRIHTWDEAEIALFEARHPIGTKARLAMALLLYTGQRRSDIVKMGPQHIRGAKVFVRQQKTGMEKRDEVLEIPLHPELATVIAASQIGNLAFLVTEWGKSFTSDGFGNKMREWCDAAGLPQCSAHGLRKAICRRLAEAGCSAPQIAAISGHKSLAEVQRYIEQADRGRLAEMAVARLTEQSRVGKLYKPPRSKLTNRDLSQ